MTPELWITAITGLCGVVATLFWLYNKRWTTLWEMCQRDRAALDRYRDDERTFTCHVQGCPHVNPIHGGKSR